MPQPQYVNNTARDEISEPFTKQDCRVRLFVTFYRDNSLASFSRIDILVGESKAEIVALRELYILQKELTSMTFLSCK